MTKLRRGRVQSLEEALSLLPRRMRSNFTLVSDSNGIQGSSALDPRAILFNEDGSFVVTFNGESSQAGYDRLEVMQFRETDKKFELRTVTFSPGGAPVASRWASAPRLHTSEAGEAGAPPSSSGGR